MSDLQIADDVIWTAVLLPVLCLVVTYVTAYIGSFKSYKIAHDIEQSGLILSLLSCLVSWAILLINVLCATLINHV